jgi:hypothetical protein
MRIWTKMLAHIAVGAFTVSSFQAAVLPANAQQTAPPAVNQEKPDQQPPSSNQQQLTTADPQSAAQQPTPPPIPTPSSSNDSLPQAPEPQPLNTPQKPVGTAAAETPSASGVAASQPAGVAIAPAKQRRVRTIVLRVGALVGVGVAVGTVVALTRATPSKPPGAR